MTMLPVPVREPPAVEMSTLLAPVAFAEHAVEALRLAHDWSARRGIGAHITLLGPFLPPDHLTPTIARLRELLAAFGPITVTLTEIRLLGSAACLVPTPVEPFAELTASLRRSWPQVPPLVGDYHLTVARNCDAALFAKVAARVEPHLPLAGQLTEATLVVRHPDGTVHEVARFPFAR